MINVFVILIKAENERFEAGEFGLSVETDETALPNIDDPAHIVNRKLIAAQKILIKERKLKITGINVMIMPSAVFQRSIARQMVETELKAREMSGRDPLPGEQSEQNIAAKAGLN